MKPVVSASLSFSTWTAATTVSPSGLTANSLREWKKLGHGLPSMASE